ncbi:MAG: type II toxin-antitoxin system ParD family antitoxin [Proteobacteria bacterium]|nr:type II toxin-antitoxin system ParD family antitoxin [Pseudomonadota bacterium]
MPRSYALGERFEHFIDTQVKNGRFNNASEVVRAGLRLLEDYENPPALTLDDLRRLILEGTKSGPGKSAEAVLGRLEEKYRRLAGQSGGA